MKIIATTRTLNEAANIDRFCQCYQWADKILIADGGSTDGTPELAAKYDKTLVRSFDKRVYRNGLWRNPHGQHINFLIDWATDEGADWIIFDDADCVPTIAMQNEARGIMDKATMPVISLYRLYIWGQDRYFPEMNYPGQSLYAWRLGDIPIRAREWDPFQHRLMGWIKEDEEKLLEPFCCLHYFFPNEAAVKRKKAFREGLGIHKIEPHPLHSFGQLDPLPDWARWK